MQQSAISFDVNGLSLEGIVAKPEGLSSPFPMAVLCNAHPGLFGALSNTLMDTLNSTFVQAGIATLRFNYRGVGGSAGTFSNGDQEGSDVFAAIRLANAWPGIRQGHIAVVGYSFGAGLLLRMREKLKGVRAVVLIAPPPASLERAPLLQEKLPKLFVVGGQDRVAPPMKIEQLLTTASYAPRLHIIAKVNHSWRGGETETAERCAAFLSQYVQ
ncbi:MAG: hypothetical protein EXR67_07185 [Dehalococcoidia bacterium]|nr:hypothetical protein [Dehalococcoidia bacterium]